MTLVEQVARALYRQHAPSLGPLETSEDRGWRHYAADARTSITAMRKPTDVMTYAGDEAIIERLNDHTFALKEPTVAVLSWQAMIDAALKE